MRLRWPSRRALVTAAIGGVAGLQLGVVAILSGLAAWRKRRARPQGFPHDTLPEVQVGENTLRVYTYGQDLYGAMLEAIDCAHESIYLETFIWKDDEVGRDFKARLIDKAEAGVDVRVVFDWFGNLVVPRAFKVFPPCVRVCEYQPISRPWHLLDPRRYALDHRKLLVIDGRVGFLGGYNLGSLYATEWRDTHLRIEGPAAAQLAHLFVDFWNRQLARPDRVRRHYPRQFDPLIVARHTDTLQLSFPIRGMYIAAIDRAERRILITNAYFIPDGSLVDSLVEAAERGVDVEILIPWNSNHPTADWLARGYFIRCLRAGIRIFAYKTMIHAKTCTVDGEWSTIGTANLDRLSSVGNYEVNVEVYSRDLARQMEGIFAEDRSDAEEITLEHWERRPWPWKAGERILEPLRNLM